MRNTQYLGSRHQVNRAPAPWMEDAPDLGVPENLVTAALAALNDMGNIVSRQCIAHPDTLTEDRITAYALALLRLRECARAAKLERLMNACDALAVTVSQLIEDRRCACRGKCEALTRFVAHAEAMIQMSNWQGSLPRPGPGIRLPAVRSF